MSNTIKDLIYGEMRKRIEEMNTRSREVYVAKQELARTERVRSDAAGHVARFMKETDKHSMDWHGVTYTITGNGEHDVLRIHAIGDMRDKLDIILHDDWKRGI